MHFWKALIALLPISVTSAPLISDLRVDGLITPLAAPPLPRFSWAVGGIQTNYRIVVSSTYPFTAQLWDSGVVVSNASWLIPYPNTNTPLSPNTDVSWTVTINIAGIGSVSSSSLFSTAPATPLPGSWLGFADTMRGSLMLSNNPVRRARLYATGVGCYQLYLNGNLISSPLSPGFGHAPSARALFDTYDVALQLRTGENVVGLRIGSCKWGAFGQYCTGTASQCNAGWASLVIDQGMGNISAFTTGSGGGWTAVNSSVLYQHLWNGELFDSRLEQIGWSSPNFTNFSMWQPVTVVDTSDLIGPLQAAVAPAIDIGLPLTPISISSLSNDVHVFDLGVNIAGFCGIDLQPPQGESPAPAGIVISLLHGELINANGSVYNHYLPPGGTHQPDGLNQPQMNYTYILRGNNELAEGPRFAYFGFRYVELRGWPYSTPPMTSSLSCNFIHSALTYSGDINFPSNPQLSLLQQAVLRTHLANYVSLPTDCPQREKRGWSGDAQLTARSGMLNFQSVAFYESWHLSILDQQRIGCLPAGEAPGRVGGIAGAPIRPHNWACDPPMKAVPNLTLAQYQYGPVSDVVPREQIGMGYFIGDPSWEVAATTIPYELLTSLGDLRHVVANYDGPVSLLAFFNALGQANASTLGLIDWSYLGDWVAIDTPNNKLVANVNYFMAAMQVAEIASAAGNAADATKYLALAALLSTSIRNRFWNVSAAHWDRGSQSAQVLCLAFGVGGADLVAPAATALLSGLDATNGTLTVGASGARFLLNVLNDAVGRPDVALNLALQTATPSWGAMFLNNSESGTFWESWFLDDVAGGSSLNHIFKAGGISPYLYEIALGLRFAMRPSAPADAAIQCGSCADALGLPWGVRERFGLDCLSVASLCNIVEKARENPEGMELQRLASATREHAGVVTGGLEARVAMTISSAAAIKLGAARGWRATPVGNASFAWHTDPTRGMLTIELTAPASATVLLELPLPNDAQHVRVSIDGDAGGFMMINPISLHMLSVQGAAAAWEPRLLPCAGVASSFVDGRTTQPPLAQCTPVLVVKALAGEHVVVLTTEL